MSGHSKWATIKRKKAAIDAKRGKAFTKVLREIQVAARIGGGNPEGNPRLKSAITAAKAVSMPGDNIERAIKRGTGDLEGVQYEETIYEGYGPGGVAFLVKCLTDNKNRTASEIRSMFTRAGGSLAGVNAVAYLFSEKGEILIKKSSAKEEQVFDVALESGAEDVSDEDDSWRISTTAQDYLKIKQALEKIAPDLEGEVQMVPSTTAKVAGKEAESVLKLMGFLDEHDDVQSVSANFDIDEAEMERISVTAQ